MAGAINYQWKLYYQIDGITRLGIFASVVLLLQIWLLCNRWIYHARNIRTVFLSNVIHWKIFILSRGGWYIPFPHHLYLLLLIVHMGAHNFRNHPWPRKLFCKIMVQAYWPMFTYALHWRHIDYDGASNQQPYGCLPNRLFRRRSKETLKLHVTGLCVGNSPGPVNSLHKGPVTRKMFPFDDFILE